MKHKILAPHKEQDGWVYVRVTKDPLRHRDGTSVMYNDRPSYRRVISSRRVEQAVETWDYLQLCAEEGLVAVTSGDSWFVYGEGVSLTGTPGGFHMAYKRGEQGHTLREAYHRYRAKEGNRQ